MNVLDSPITVTSRFYTGEIKKSWQARLVDTGPERIVALGHFDQEIEHPDLGLIRRGTWSFEFFWHRRWYNVFRFHEPDGSLKLYYCNITLPPTVSEGSIDYIDMDIDVLVWPDLSFRVLDEKEFFENGRIFGYPTELIDKVCGVADQLTDAIVSGNFMDELREI